VKNLTLHHLHLLTNSWRQTTFWWSLMMFKLISLVLSQPDNVAVLPVYCRICELVLVTNCSTSNQSHISWCTFVTLSCGMRVSEFITRFWEWISALCFCLTFVGLKSLNGLKLERLGLWMAFCLSPVVMSGLCFVVFAHSAWLSWRKEHLCVYL
jgi:hypothetical protein